MPKDSGGAELAVGDSVQLLVVGKVAAILPDGKVDAVFPTDRAFGNTPTFVSVVCASTDTRKS